MLNAEKNFFLYFFTKFPTHYFNFKKKKKFGGEGGRKNLWTSLSFYIHPNPASFSEVAARNFSDF